jgi:Tol biopolymer transport system component
MTESAQSIEGTREWTDVYIQQGDGKAKNVSRCDRSNCGQPSLSPDGKTVVYIQSQREQ